jgi:iron complex outermembrane receptor protein
VVVAGIKDANYQMTLNQYQDNSKTVGCLGGTLSSDPVTGAPICIGGAAFTTHGIDYNTWLPNLSARYYIKNNWSVYAQFAEGSIIPPSNVFDVPNAQVLTPPKPTVAKTYQTGSVMKFHSWTLDADYYYIHFQNGYDSYTDPATLEPVFVATGPSNTQGFEAESNFAIGWGFSSYVNFSAGTAKYQTGSNFPNGGMWVANAPSNVEGISLMWRYKNWDIGFIDKRVGQMYNDNGTLTYNINGIKIPYPVDQAIKIDPFNLANFFANYTIKNASWLRGRKIGLAINNLADNHAIVGSTPAIAATATVPYAPNSGDLLNLLPGRSIMVTITAVWAPRR